MVALEGRVGRGDPHGPLACADVAAAASRKHLRLVGEGEVVVVAAQPTPFMRKNSYTKLLHFLG